MNALAYSESPTTATLETRPFDLHALMSSRQTIKFKRHDGTTEDFTPDDSKGYFEFETAFGWPAGESLYGTGFHPQTLANSFHTLQGQSLDYEHRKQILNPKLQGDHYLGYIAAVDFPRSPSNEGWKLTHKPSPHISGVAGFWKQAAGLKRILGEHMTGRHQWTISYDVDWGGNYPDLKESIRNTSSFAVQIPPGEQALMGGDVEEYVKSGYEYIPGHLAPDDLLATIAGGDGQPTRVVKSWRGRKVSLLMNERAGSVHFAGIALVRYGAERAANIKTVVASATTPLADSLDQVRQVMGQMLVGRIVKRA